MSRVQHEFLCKTFCKGRIAFIAAIIFSLCCTGCVQPPPSPPPSEQPSATVQEYFEHRITHSGETLGIIAKHYTGRTQYADKLIEANPGIRPERLRIGQIVRIPRSIMITDAPLPKSIVKASSVKQPVDTSPPVDSTEMVSGVAGSAAEQVGTATAAGASVEPVYPSTVSPIADSPGSASSGVLPSSERANTSSSVEKPVATPPSPTAAAPAPTNPADLEREKLLEELLKQ
jgi:hypothetical protein